MRACLCVCVSLSCLTVCLSSALISIDVTEVQIFIMLLYLLAAVGGSAFWQSPVIQLSQTISASLHHTPVISC